MPADAGAVWSRVEAVAQCDVRPLGGELDSEVVSTADGSTPNSRLGSRVQMVVRGLPT